MDTFDYIVKLNEVRGKFTGCVDKPEPSWVRITTITMISKFNSEIDIAKFREVFSTKGPIRIRPKNSNFSGFVWSMMPTAFYNQVTIGYADAYSRKSIKLFPNGSIQVAGCSNLYDCKRILHQLTLIVKDTLGLEELEAQPPRISMINTNFTLNTSVNLHKVINVLKQADFKITGACRDGHPVPPPQGFKVTYDPDRYSAVKVKFTPGPDMKQVTASIFKTGKIIVTGAQQLSEIVAAYDLLNQHITKDTFIENVEKPELFDTIMGAKFVDWVQQIKLRA